MKSSTNYAHVLWFITSILFLISFVISVWVWPLIGGRLGATYSLVWGLLFIFTVAIGQGKSKK